LDGNFNLSALWRTLKVSKFGIRRKGQDLRIKKEKKELLGKEVIKMTTLIILGGGAFGLSTAYYALKNKKFNKVLILDRMPLPAIDGIDFLDLNREHKASFFVTHHLFVIRGNK
jgi:hypothetical protein